MKIEYVAVSNAYYEHWILEQASCITSVVMG